jgi:hypothetical protein
VVTYMSVPSTILLLQQQMVGIAQTSTLAAPDGS